MILRAGVTVLTALLCSGGADARAQTHPASAPTSLPAHAPTHTPTSAPTSAQTTRAQALTRAEAAFVAGELQRAAALAATVEGGDRFAGRARFIEGYARYKLGQLDHAARLLARSRALDPQPETTFLSGLVAFERRTWDAALALLRPLAAASAAGTWSASAARLVARIERQRVDERAKKSSEATRAAHARAIIQARAHLEAGQTDKALAALKKAETAPPASRPGAPPEAPPSEPTTESQGARRALSIHALLELGTGLDTNPAAPVAQVRALTAAWIPQSPVETSLALGGQADLSLRYALSAAQRGALGLRLSEHGNAAGSADLAQTTLDAWIRYTLEHRLLELRASYGYTFILLDHASFYGEHVLNLEAAFPLGRPWLHLLAAPRLVQRDAHDDAYALLEGTKIAGALALRFRLRRMTLQVGWALQRTWAGPTDVEASTRKDLSGNDVKTNFRVDLTSLAHGPRLRLRLALPWRLTLTAAAAVSWTNHDAADRFVLLPLDATIRAFQRRDVQIQANAELSRPLGLGFELALAFSSEDNLSERPEGSPVDWSYERRTLLSSLRWRWDYAAGFDPPVQR
jgi:tetratricopeptide (TPR) repeat protein